MKQFLVKVAHISSCVAVFSGAFIYSFNFFNRIPLQPSLDALGIQRTDQIFSLSSFLFFSIS